MKLPRTKKQLKRLLDNAAVSGYFAAWNDKSGGNGFLGTKRDSANRRRQIRAELARWMAT